MQQASARGSLASLAKLVLLVAGVPLAGLRLLERSIGGDAHLRTSELIGASLLLVALGLAWALCLFGAARRTATSPGTRRARIASSAATIPNVYPVLLAGLLVIAGIFVARLDVAHLEAARATANIGRGRARVIRESDALPGVLVALPSAQHGVLSWAVIALVLLCVTVASRRALRRRSSHGGATPERSSRPAPQDALPGEDDGTGVEAWRGAGEEGLTVQGGAEGPGPRQGWERMRAARGERPSPAGPRGGAARDRGGEVDDVRVAGSPMPLEAALHIGDQELRALLVDRLVSASDEGVAVLAATSALEWLLPGVGATRRLQVAVDEHLPVVVSAALVERRRRLDERLDAVAAGVLESVPVDPPLSPLLVVMGRLDPAGSPQWEALQRQCSALGVDAAVLDVARTAEDAALSRAWRVLCRPESAAASDPFATEPGAGRPALEVRGALDALADLAVGEPPDDGRSRAPSAQVGSADISPVASVAGDEVGPEDGHAPVASPRGETSARDRCFEEHWGTGEAPSLQLSRSDVAWRGEDEDVGIASGPSSDDRVAAAVRGLPPRPISPVDVAVPVIELLLLGPFRIVIGGVEARSGWRVAAKELLTWYAVNRDGGSTDMASTDLWPQLAPDQARQRCWVSLSDIRKAARHVTEGQELLPRFGTRYRLDAGLVRCDLWELEDALASAARAEGDAEARGALEEVCRLYRGELAGDLDALFIETVREQLRRRVADAHLRLAALLERDEQLEAAITVLERVVDIDPGSAEADARLIALHLTLGQVSSAEQVRLRSGIDAPAPSRAAQRGVEDRSRR